MSPSDRHQQPAAFRDGAAAGDDDDDDALLVSVTDSISFLNSMYNMPADLNYSTLILKLSM